MDLVTLIMMCSLATSDLTQTTLYQIARTTEASPTYIDDLTEGVVYEPPTLSEAADITRALVEAGHDLRVGLGQVPARQSLRQYQLTPRRLVDSCTNIAIASDRLEQARRRYPGEPHRVLSFYLTGEPDSPVGLAWADEVLAVEPVDVARVSVRPDEAPPSPRFSTPTGRLFVDEEQSEDEEHPEPHPSKRMMVSPARTIPEPEKWKPKSGHNSASTPKQAAPPPSSGKDEPAPTSTDSSAVDLPSKARHNRNLKPQPPVTIERLPTSDELEDDDRSGAE